MVNGAVASVSPSSVRPPDTRFACNTDTPLPRLSAFAPISDSPSIRFPMCTTNPIQSQASINKRPCSFFSASRNHDRLGISKHPPPNRPASRSISNPNRMRWTQAIEINGRSTTTNKRRHEERPFPHFPLVTIHQYTLLQKKRDDDYQTTRNDPSITTIISSRQDA